MIMSLVSDLKALVEEEEELAQRAKAYNAKKAEYNRIRLSQLDDDAINEHYTTIKEFNKDKKLLDDMYLELAYEQSTLEELFENFNNKRRAIINE